MCHSGLVVGLDIGGTKTHALWAPAGPSRATHTIEALAPSANVLSVGVEAASAALAEAANAVGGQDVVAVTAGAAGADSPAAVAQLKQLLREHFPRARVNVVHDTEIILAAAGLAAGTVLIAGTGSAAWSRREDGTEARAGGLGYLLGDEGSGYVVVRDAVRAVLEDVQAGAVPGPLARRLAAAVGLSNSADLLDAFYGDPDRRRWAALTPCVTGADDDGDPLAAGVLDTAARNLARLVRAVQGPLDGAVVLAGGFIVNSPGLARRVRTLLEADGIHNVRTLTDPPARGALLLAEAAILRR